MKYNGYNSSSLDIASGVLQGSFLGPLLFLVHISDVCNVPKVLQLLILFDNSFLYSHGDVSYLMEVVNLELGKITC